MADTPIKTGDASSKLIPQPGAGMRTNDFGVDVGSVTYFAPSAAIAESSRPKPGDQYKNATGFAQFAGALSDSSEVVTGEGTTATLIVTCMRLSPSAGRYDDLAPEVSSDAQVSFIASIVSVNNAGVISQVKTERKTVVIPKPVLTYRFGATTFKSRMGEYDTPPNAPETKDYSYSNQIYIPLVGLKAFTYTFKPDPGGWICIKDGAVPRCGGKIYEVTQQWKMFYTYAPPDTPPVYYASS